jgi:hypothetical protein
MDYGYIRVRVPADVDRWIMRDMIDNQLCTKDSNHRTEIVHKIMSIASILRKDTEFKAKVSTQTYEYTMDISYTHNKKSCVQGLL